MSVAPAFVSAPAGLRAQASALWGSRWVRLALNSVLGCGMLLLLLRSVPAGDLVHHLRPQHASPLLGILALTLLSQLTRALRWKLLLRGSTRVPLSDALWINGATQLFNYLIPLRVGEAARLWWLSRRRGVPVAASAGLIVIDHSFDLGGVTAVLGTATVLRATSLDTHLPTLGGMLLALGLAVLMFGAIFATVLLGPRVAASALFQRVLWRGWSDRMLEHAQGFRAAAASLRSPRAVLVMVAVSGVAVGLDGLAFGLLFVAMGLAVPMLSAAVAQVQLLYTYLLPAAPGYVGSLEAGGTLVLSSGLGLPKGTAAGAMVLWHALGAIMVVALGTVAVRRLRLLSFITKGATATLR